MWFRGLAIVRQALLCGHPASRGSANGAPGYCTILVLNSYTFLVDVLDNSVQEQVVKGVSGPVLQCRWCT